MGNQGLNFLSSLLKYILRVSRLHSFNLISQIRKVREFSYWPMAALGMKFTEPEESHHLKI
jgi:hypothetical protein